ncbi:MAG: hypothetical protein OXC61_01965 [Flavobacteriaceae bacterium]|nr:hypothetical protein [Flavobacteriaceae bacterium]
MTIRTPNAMALVLWNSINLIPLYLPTLGYMLCKTLFAFLHVILENFIDKRIQPPGIGSYLL